MVKASQPPEIAPKEFHVVPLLSRMLGARFSRHGGEHLRIRSTPLSRAALTFQLEHKNIRANWRNRLRGCGATTYDAGMKALDSKVAVVTGAASGIGLALAEKFSAEGMKVVLADVDALRLEEVAKQFAAHNADVAWMVCDTSSETAVTALAQFTTRGMVPRTFFAITPASPATATRGPVRWTIGPARSRSTSTE